VGASQQASQASFEGSRPEEYQPHGGDPAAPPPLMGEKYSCTLFFRSPGTPPPGGGTHRPPWVGPGGVLKRSRVGAHEYLETKKNLAKEEKKTPSFKPFASDIFDRDFPADLEPPTYPQAELLRYFERCQRKQAIRLESLALGFGGAKQN